MSWRKLPIVPLLFAAGFLVAWPGCSRRGPTPDVAIAGTATWHERVAAKEIQRYLYLRTGVLPGILTIGDVSDLRGDVVIILQKDSPLVRTLPPSDVVGNIASLGGEDYLLRTIPGKSGRTALIAGGGGPGLLYGTYSFLEKLGIRFFLDGDVIPEERTSYAGLALDEIGRPLFPIRGIQPFHDFPEGPDWWTVENYKAVLGQLPKLRMNFFGLHTYPEKGPNAEPTVWIGRPGEFGEEGRVSSSYPSSYQNTLRGNWGYEAKKTGDFHFGAGLLFERDDFGNDVMEGLCPEPVSPEDSNEAFNRAGAVFRDAFSFARRLGIKLCVGTETPLTVPELVRGRVTEAGDNPSDPDVVKDLYRGIFERIRLAYPVDYYWFWTWEGWTWDDASPEAIEAVKTDLAMAVEAWKEVAPPFGLATCGWVLGPPSDRTLFDRILPPDIAMSCINREVGKAPVDPGFARIRGRSKWVIPWLEDDPALTSPQLWVGRMRRDAVDALRYGCDGLLGIHWRTRILSPNVSALARAAWDQSWNPLPESLKDETGPVSGRFVSFAGRPVGGANRESEIYRDVRDRVFGYTVSVPDGIYEVILKFIEGEIGQKGRRVFDVFIQGRRVAEKVDIFGSVGLNKAYDLTFQKIEVTDGRLKIDFADRIHYPAVAGIVISGKNCVKKINCGGPAVLDYEADWPETARHLDSMDFYRDWAEAQFGPTVAPRIAEVFAGIDGKHPVPVTWIGGPGNIRPDGRPWDEVKGEYGFVDELAALEPDITGSGCRERFAYWLTNFRYMREIARFNCLWAVQNSLLGKAGLEISEARRTRIINDEVLPARAEMAKSLGMIYECLLATVSNTGELGTIANWEQHILPGAWERPGAELEKMLGEELPGEVALPREYDGPPRIIVPAVRTSLDPGERLELRILVLSKVPPASAEFAWRGIGRGDYRTLPLEKAGRGVYRVSVPVTEAGIEYYIKVSISGKDFLFPATAPGLNGTVIVLPRD